MQALVRRRFGLRWFPVATVVVFAVTATAGVLQALVPGMLGALERTPAGLHGDWWRSLTSLFVQDGGVAGTVSNLAFLLVMGVLAEQFLGPGRWLVCYFGAGLAGELVGYAWQPRGAGNSVAVCGLAGALVVALAAGTAVPRLAPMVVLWWCGALLSLYGGAIPLVACVAGAAVVQLTPASALVAGRVVAVVGAGTAVALAAVRDIHGAAMLAGILIAAALRV